MRVVAGGSGRPQKELPSPCNERKEEGGLPSTRKRKREKGKRTVIPASPSAIRGGGGDDAVARAEQGGRNERFEGGRIEAVWNRCCLGRALLLHSRILRLTHTHTHARTQEESLCSTSYVVRGEGGGFSSKEEEEISIDEARKVPAHGKAKKEKMAHYYYM